MRWNLAGAAALLALCAACATHSKGKWTAPPKATLTVEAAAAVAAAVAHSMPECPADRVYSDEFKDLIQATGCGKVLYLKKVAKVVPARWSRVGPEFDVAPENDLHEAELRLQGATLRAPVQLLRMDPMVTVEQARKLRSWLPKAVGTCLLGVDGALHACLVESDDEVLNQAVASALAKYRFRAATADGTPVPATFQINITVPVPKPNCDVLSDPLAQSRCRRALDSPDGPAAADPEIWELPLSW